MNGRIVAGLRFLGYRFSQGAHVMKTRTFPVKGLNVAGCAREIEKRLAKQAAISQVAASYVTQTVTITFDDARLSEAALREQVQDCGFACGGPMQLAPMPARSRYRVVPQRLPACS